MGMAGPLTLVSNPGSASRKYGLFKGDQLITDLHFEWANGKIICTIKRGEDHVNVPTKIESLNSAAGEAVKILKIKEIMRPNEHIGRIGLRVVAPGTYFAEHKVVTQHYVDTLQRARARAPIHIAATLEELKALHHQFPQATIVAASDSAFHASRPDFAAHYSIPLHDSQKLDIKRFGYHGLSAESVVEQLKAIGKLTPRLIIVHLGSGASVTAVYHGKSIDNTMGYSPLEGLTMATRSGSIDFTAVRALKAGLGLDDARVEEYLNHKSGLLGLGGSNDIRELLKREQKGDKHARLAMQTYLFNVQKAIGQMAGSIGGIDQLVFTGTVGERNPLIRKVIAERLDYLDILLDVHANKVVTQPKKPTRISMLAQSRPVLVVPANEAQIIAAKAQA